jgi:hypothetical protein
MTLTTIVTLGNAAELVAQVAEKVLGKEVADTFAGSPLSKDMVHQLSQSVFQKKIAKELGE